MYSPYKRPKPTLFTERITRFKYHRRAKLPRNIRVYEGNKDPKDHLSIFSAVAEQEESSMPVWCKMFCQTLGGAAQNWFDDLDPNNVDNFEEICKKFLEKFSQQKRYAKGPYKGISHQEKTKQEVVRPSQWEKGNVRPSWFGGPKKSRNRGGPRETRRNIGIYTPYPRKDTFTPLIKTPKEILAMENLKKRIEEVVASGKLAHLVKDIRWNNQRNGSQGRNNVKVINMIRGGGNRKRHFEGERFGLTDELTFLAIPRNRLTDEPIILEGRIEDHQTKKMQSSANRFLRRNVPPFRSNRPLSNYGRGMKEQNSANGVCNSKMSFAVQCHNRKDRNEKPQSTGKGARFIEGADCKRLSTNVLRENIEVFTWAGSKTPAVPRFVMEHQLKIYPIAELVVHKRRLMTPDGRQELKERVFHWLKEGKIRKVQHPE
ncbi:hypothetical protein Tco_1095725 [Tanacetum coccineum]